MSLPVDRPPDRILETRDLHVEFHTEEGLVRAVNGVNFELRRGETLGVVGESGSGKTVTNLALLGLIPQPPGRVTRGEARFDGRDLLAMNRRELAAIRGRRIAMIFQDPMTALNPFLTIEQQLTEVTRRHLGYGYRAARRHAVEMLQRVGIPAADARLDDYPHQFSGGMRQRVMIAMALSCHPEVLIADEPTTALDVTIQAQILELMKRLQRDEGTAIILITHDLGIVANICDRVMVMYGGRIVEEAECQALFDDPRHPYTRGLLQSVPRIDEQQHEQLHAIEGQPPDLAHLPAGCCFQPRCEYAVEQCGQQVPPLEEVARGGRSACFVDLDEVPSTDRRA